MKDKIKARLKAKFSGVNLSQKRMDAVADKLAKRLTDESEESEIDEALDDLNEIYAFSDIAKSDDRVRTEAKKKTQDPPKKEDENEEDPKDEVPLWAKGLLKANEELNAKLATLESGKTLESRKSILEKKLENASEKVKSSYLKQFERMNFTDDEDFNSYVADVETESKELTQEISNNGLKGFGKPNVAGGKVDKLASDDEAKSVLDKIM